MSQSTQVEIVENPRRRRHYTAKQRAYGFGGKRRVATTHRRRRRNPAGLVSYAVNGRRRRRRAPVVRHALLMPNRGRRRSYRRHRNPGLLGGLGLDFKGLLWMGGGGMAVKYAPKFIANTVWSGMPTTGITGKLVQVGIAFAGSKLVKMFAGQKAASEFFNGGVLVVLLDFANEQLAPMLGLSDYVYLNRGQLAPVLSSVGVSDYVYAKPGGGSTRTNIATMVQ